MRGECAWALQASGYCGNQRITIQSGSQWAGPTEKWPWPYVKLDPEKTAEIAYNEWYRVFCGAAVISSVFSQLREKVGEPYKSFPDRCLCFSRRWHGGLGNRVRLECRGEYREQHDYRTQDRRAGLRKWRADRIGNAAMVFRDAATRVQSQGTETKNQDHPDDKPVSPLPCFSRQMDEGIRVCSCQSGTEGPVCTRCSECRLQACARFECLERWQVCLKGELDPGQGCGDHGPAKLHRMPWIQTYRHHRW